MRIVPLAWLVLAVTFVNFPTGWNSFLPHFLFYANWEPMALTPPTSHFWSLCVEMQFYATVALLVFFLKKKAFFILPVLCIIVTIIRWHDGVSAAINTYYRIDEILAGCILALLYNGNHDVVKKSVPVAQPSISTSFCDPDGSSKRRIFSIFSTIYEHDHGCLHFV